VVKGGILIAVGLPVLWYGVLHTYDGVQEVLEYRRAPLCQAESAAGCVEELDALVVRRSMDKGDSELGPAYLVWVRAAGHVKRHTVSQRFFESIPADGQVRVRRFHGKNVKILTATSWWETGELRSPAFPGLVGALIWSALTLTLVVGVERWTTPPSASGTVETVDVRLVLGSILFALVLLALWSYLQLSPPMQPDLDPRGIFVCWTVPLVGAAVSITRLLGRRLMRNYRGT
jgi:hypothetical protein